MTSGIQEAMATLAAFADELRPARSTDALANDLYEAADDWRNLGELVLQDSDRTDFQRRAQQEVALMTQLRAVMAQRFGRQPTRYEPLFEAGETLIQAALRRKPRGEK